MKEDKFLPGDPGKNWNLPASEVRVRWAWVNSPLKNWALAGVTRLMPVLCYLLSSVANAVCPVWIWSAVAVGGDDLVAAVLLGAIHGHGDGCIETMNLEQGKSPWCKGRCGALVYP
jgi:hypothetical protein